eukprot:SAG11_NODE_19670_length_461_cov_1.549724_1_plen_97_part_01
MFCESKEMSAEEREGARISLPQSISLFALITTLVTMSSESMVDVLAEMTANNSRMTQTFVGVVLLPFASNMAELGSAVCAAKSNKLNLAQVAVAVSV